jgi:hypothetical protein
MILPLWATALLLLPYSLLSLSLTHRTSVTAWIVSAYPTHHPHTVFPPMMADYTATRPLPLMTTPTSHHPASTRLPPLARRPDKICKLHNTISKSPLPKTRAPAALMHPLSEIWVSSARHLPPTPELHTHVEEPSGLPRRQPAAQNQH